MPSQDPQTDDELEELERFLLDAEGIDESMDITLLDGFCAAILSGPKTIAAQRVDALGLRHGERRG